MLSRRYPLFSALLVLLVMVCLFSGSYGKMPDASQIAQMLNLVKERCGGDSRLSYFDVKVQAEGHQLVLRGKVADADQKMFVLAGFRQLSVPVVDQIEIFPFKDVSIPYGLVSAPLINAYETPSEQSRLITQYLYASSLRILRLQTEWALVQSTQDRYIAWVKRSDLLTLSNERYEQLALFDTVIVRNSEATVYQNANLSGPAQKVLLATRLPLLADDQNAYQISYPAADRTLKLGYISKTDARLYVPNQFDNPGGLLSDAQLYLNTPWKAGGATIKGWDSAAYVQTVYRLQGITIPREAEQQRQMSLQIRSLDLLKPGDLVFWGHKQVGFYLGDKRLLYMPENATHLKTASIDPKSPDYVDEIRKEFQCGGRITAGSTF